VNLENDLPFVSIDQKGNRRTILFVSQKDINSARYPISHFSKNLLGELREVVRTRIGRGRSRISGVRHCYPHVVLDCTAILPQFLNLGYSF